MPFAPPAPDEIESAGFTPPERLGGFTPPSPDDTEELGQETSLSPSEVETGPDEKPAGFLRSLARGFVAPLKATAKGVGIATLSDDTLQTALNSEWQKNQNATEPTTAGKVGEMVGGLGGTLAQMLVTGRAGPAGIAAQFGSQGAYDSFMAAGQRALSEGHSLADATQIGKYAALTGVGTGILLGLVPGGHDTWKQVVSTALKMGAAGGGQKLLENVAQQNQGLQTPTWEGVPEAAATMALIPPGMKVLGSGLAALARMMPGRGRGRILTTDNTDDADGDGGGGTPAVAPVTAPQADAAVPGDAGTAADVRAGLNLLGRGIRAGAQDKAEEYARRILGGQPIEEVTQGLGPVMRQAIGEAITRLKESELQNAIQESKAASVHVQPAPADRAALAEGGGTAEWVAGAQPEPKRVALEPDADQEALKPVLPVVKETLPAAGEIQPLGEKPNPPELAQKPDFMRGQTVLHTDPATGVPREVKFDFEYGDGTARVRSGLNQWRVPVAELTNKPRAPRVNRGLNFKAQFDRETQEMGEPDLLGWLRDHGGMMSRSAALKLWGKKKFAENASLWEDAQPFATHHHQAIFGGSNTPDQVVQALNMKSNLDVHGNFGVTDVNTLWHEINQASKARANRGNAESAANQRLSEDLAQHQAWFKATQKKPGLHEVTTESIGVGDVLEVGGERVKVTARSPDTGDLRLEDGKTFGEQKLEEGQVLYVEKVEPSYTPDFNPEMESILMLAADIREKLRATDVERVMAEAQKEGKADEFRKWMLEAQLRPETKKAIQEWKPEELTTDNTDKGKEELPKAGDHVRFTPKNPKWSVVDGQVQEVLNGGEGFNIFTPTPDDPTRVLRVWLEDGKVEKVERLQADEQKTAKPSAENLTLGAPESVEEQKARLIKEATAKLERETAATEEARKAEALRKGAAPLGGDLGTAGQGELLAKPGQQEIFQATPAQAVKPLDKAAELHEGARFPGLNEVIAQQKQVVLDRWNDLKKLGISPDGDLQRQLALYKSLYDLAVLYARKGVKTAGEFADAVGMKAGAILNRAWADASSGKPAETNPAKLPRLTAEEAKEISAPRQTTQVLGAEMGIGSRPGASPQADAAAVAKQHDLIVQAGGQLAHLVEPGARGLVKFVPDGFTHEAEGHNLVKLINDELPANWEASGAEPYSLTALFNSIRTAWWDGSLKDVFGEPVARKLFTTVQAPISHWGLLLQSVQRFGNSIAAIAKDPLVHLRYEWGKAFGGETYDRLFDRVMATLLPDLDRNAKEALREHPQVEDLFKTLMEQNARAAGSRVFRKADFLLGPKAAKRIEAMKRDAEVNEAVQEILNQARRLHGLEPPKRPGRTKLTPVEELLHLVNRDNAARIDDSIKTAVRQAERNAARNIVQAEGSLSEEEMALYDQRTLDPKVEAIDPTDEQVERGLDSKRWRPWQKVRETLADYSPVTLDLAQRVIKGDFKGTRFKPAPEKAADLRIDLKKLAVGPEAEVKRVLDAWQEAVSQSVDLAGATPETRLRIRAMMEKELATQLELKRQQARDPLFAEKIKKGVALSPEEKMLQLLNAKLFADPRLDVPGMVERLAGKTAISKLLPSLGELVGKILETPFFKQAELKSRFVEELTQRLNVDPAQAEKAWVTFESAFASRFAAAKAKAAERALKDLTPAERKVTQGRGLIEKIQRNLNAGNFDSGDVIEQIARAKGERVPDPADVAKLKSMGERLARLQQLDDKEMAELTATKATPEQIEKARLEKEAKTRSLQATLSRDMSTLWASMWRPLNLRSFTSGRGWRNVRDASRDYVVLNLLTKVGHLVRFPIHLATQVATHFGSRPLAQAFELAGQRGNVMASWEDIGRAYQQEWEGMKAGLRPALVGGRAEALGRGEGRNVDALMETMHTFGRLEQQAEKYKAQGNWPMYVLTKILGIPNYAGRYISVVDQWQGAPAVYADILHQADLEMAGAGHSGAERVAMQGDLVKAMKYEIAQAMHETGLVLQSTGQPFTPKQVEENAWGLVKFRLEELIRNAGLPADAMRETTEALRRQLSWQDEVRRGVGGPVAKSLQWLGKAVPTLGAFSNAIGHGLNWTLAKLPPGLHYLADVNLIGKAGEEPSNYFRTSLDKKQRLIESIGVTMGGAMLAGLLMNRMARFNPFITSANERAEMEREGRKPGTIDFLLPDGKVSTWSLIVGPMSLFAPWISAFGSASNLQQRREGAQKRLDEEATRKGLAPGKIRELGLLDYAGVAAQAAMTSILGSKTASGWTTQFVDPNQGFAAKRAIASQIQPFITGLPGWGEISRMMGVSMSQNRATVFDYLVPLPGSGARAVNALGDPVGTRDGLQRVVQVLTGGSYPFPHGREAVTDAAYAALIGSGYQPPSVSPNQGYDVKGEFRPLNNEELAKYTVKRGQLFKAALEKLGAGADHEAVQEAYAQANAEALATVGAQTATAATRESQTPRVSGVGAVTALARARRALPGLRRARAGGGRVRGGLGRRLGSGRGRGALGRR